MIVERSTNPVVLVQPLTRPEETLRDIGTLFSPQAPYLLISAWPTPDLRPHGLALIGHPPLMVRFPSPRPDSPGPEADVREVKDSDELMVAERVLVEGYPMLELEPLKPGALLGPDAAAAGHSGLARVVGRATGGGSGGAPTRRGHARRVRCDIAGSAGPRCRCRGDVGRHPRRPGRAGGADRQRRRATRIRTTGLCRRRTVDRLAPPGTVGGRRLHSEHSGTPFCLGQLNTNLP